MENKKEITLLEAFELDKADTDVNVNEVIDIINQEEYFFKVLEKIRISQRTEKEKMFQVYIAVQLMIKQESVDKEQRKLIGDSIVLGLLVIAWVLQLILLFYYI